MREEHSSTGDSAQERILATRRQTWRDFSRLLFWGPVHLAVALIVVMIFLLNGPTLTSWIFAVILFGGNFAITAAVFASKQW